MSDLTWDDLDAMVEGDPLLLRDRAWDEIRWLRQRLEVSEAKYEFVVQKFGEARAEELRVKRLLGLGGSECST